MNPARLLLFTAVAGALALGGCATPDLPSQATDGELRTLDGKVVRASTFWSDRPVLLVFMTAWCLSCQEEIPHLNELSKRHAVVAVSVGDPPERVEQLRRRKGITYPVYLDAGAFAKAYEIHSTPTCILIDRGGAIRHRGSKPPGDL